MLHLPDGVYDAVIDDVDLRRAPGTFTNVLTWHLRVEGVPQPVDRTLCITERTLSWLKEDLGKCGLILHKLSDLPQRLRELRGRAVVLEKRTREGNERLYFRRATP